MNCSQKNITQSSHLGCTTASSRFFFEVGSGELLNWRSLGSLSQVCRGNPLRAVKKLPALFGALWGDIRWFPLPLRTPTPCFPHPGDFPATTQPSRLGLNVRFALTSWKVILPLPSESKTSKASFCSSTWRKRRKVGGEDILWRRKLY